jgi:hypothetical protein
LGFILSSLSIIEKYFLSDWFISAESIRNNLPWLSYPLWVVFFCSVFLLFGAVLLPYLSIKKFEKFQNRLYSIFEKLTVLTIFYIVLDVAAIIIIIVRNFQNPGIK